MYKKILVPLDESASAEAALPHAQAIAKQFGAELVLVSVIVPPLSGDPSATKAITDAEADEDKSYLAQKAAELTKSGLRVSTRLLEGLVSESIVAAAKSAGADMIVMGTHGRTGLRHLVMGSVAEVVVQHASVPVVLVRAP